MSDVFFAALCADGEPGGGLLLFSRLTKHCQLDWTICSRHAVLSIVIDARLQACYVIKYFCFRQCGSVQGCPQSRDVWLTPNFTAGLAMSPIGSSKTDSVARDSF